eukprot:NODE_293_length_10559_cov_1.046463.p2 type:complete len:570 gc:universal NODE_293_length_10559_cov_1.046463:2635-926(-)
MNHAVKSILIFYFTLITSIYGVSTDCSLIMKFLQGLNMHLTDRVLYQKIPADCCNFRSTNDVGDISILCEGSGSSQIISELALGRLNINGVILSQFLPPNITGLFIRNGILNCNIPEDLPNKINYLDLGNNAIQGAIPENLPSSLVQLYLNNNQMSGLPASFPSKITNLYLNDNRFTKIPKLPPIVENVDIRNNLIVDKMIDTFPESLFTFDASRNMIYGAYYTNSIVSLCLSFNQINGTIPNYDYFNHELKVDHNLLEGHLPPKWNNDLNAVDVSYNLLSGSIPNFNTSSYFMNFLDFSGNSFTGNIPYLFTTLALMVDFSHNQLSGDINLGYASINDLRLSFNKFKKYPKSLPQYIYALKLDHNEISGSIWYDLPSTLIIIDLSCNNLTGKIPYWEQIPVVANWLYDTSQVLNISRNRFTGTIPSYLSSIPTLDLSHNYLSGCSDFQFTGKNYYLNNNYLSGNLSFDAPYVLQLQNNSLFDVSIANQMNLQQCDLSENPLGPGVSGKTFHSLCNLNGTFVSGNETLAYNSSKCEPRIFGFEPVEIITTPFKTTTVPPTIIKRIFLFI